MKPFEFNTSSKWATADRPFIALVDPVRLMTLWQVEVRGHAFDVPTGTTTDGASIPRFLWRLCGHPLEVPRVYAATLHDWLYGGAVAGLTRKEADKCYYALLRHFGVSAFRAAVEYRALRLFGGSHWQGSCSTKLNN